jgi:glycosyltransferase involved in cell wall biosynthesis
MKVLLVAGMGETPEAHLFPELAARGIQVDLICDTSSPYFVPLTAARFPMNHLRIAARIDPHAIRMIRRFLKAGSYDILHAFTSRGLSNGVIASAGMQVRRIGYCGTMGHISRWDPAAYLALLNPSVDRIICNSDAIAGYLQSIGLPKTRVKTIRKGQDPGWYTAAPRSALKTFGVPDQAVVIGCTANIRPIKGIPVLIEAMRLLMDRLPIHLLLAGHADRTELCRLTKVPRLDERIHLTGYRTDAPGFMGACDMFVMPTLKNEGLSKAVMEAMSLRVPPIVTAVGGMMEIVKDGLNGRVVPPGDPRALASAIADYAVSEDLRRIHGERSHHRIVTEFSFADWATGIVRLYESLLNPITVAT